MKNELFDRCITSLEVRLNERKLSRHKAPPAYYANAQISVGIALSTIDGEAGTITRAWGFIFNNPDYPLRCTDIHSSYYGEAIALDRLFKELNKL
jgi:hypothetical protein